MLSNLIVRIATRDDAGEIAKFNVLFAKETINKNLSLALTTEGVLVGGDGNDDLHGGYDKDRATGGAGADWFVFDGDGSSQHYGQMSIVDFAAIEDGSC